MITTFILLLYVLPMIVSGLGFYLDKSTKTLGDLLKYSLPIFTPFANIAFLIFATFEYLSQSNLLKRIKDIKIKSVIIFFFLFLFISCGNSENIEISKEQYRQFKNLPPERDLILGNQENCKIITASDNHEYYSQKVGMSGYAVGDIYLHYIDCQFCAKRLKTERK